MDKIYKIKNSIIGLYSKGGSRVNDSTDRWSKKLTYNCWSKKGKIWQSKGGLKSHLRQYCHTYKSQNPITGELFNYSFPGSIGVKGWWNDIPETWMIEEYDIKNSSTTTYSAKSLYPL